MSSQPSPSSAAKYQRLLARLRELQSVLVAYSGGVDSAFLAEAAFTALGKDAEAVTAVSPSLAPEEREAALATAKAIGISHRFVQTHEITRPGYVQNGPDRCYHCKSELFDVTGLLAKAEGRVVVDGFNADDLKDYRPGHQAAEERSVRHPLAEVELTKAEIRELSRWRGLPTWDKPQLACLASRLPYGMAVTPERLTRVAQVERALQAEGFHDVRARLVKGEETLVRIEVGQTEFDKLLDADRRARLVKAAKAVGFHYVTLDLEPFQSGRMNQALIQIGA